MLRVKGKGRTICLLGFVGAAIACSSEPGRERCIDDPSAPGCDCPTGFEWDGTGEGCVDLRPASPCPAGTRAAFGSTECVAVGRATCPDWADLHPTGWGCEERVPAVDCTAPGTREVLGDTQCRPLGDCAAPFPPAGATRFVDDDYGPGALDATHFATIASAVSGAPTNSVIAIEAGLYSDSVFVASPMELIGRCAEQVRLVGPGTGPAGGLQVQGVEGVVLSGITISGYLGGVVVAGGSIDLAQLELTGNRGAGLVVTGGGSAIARDVRFASNLQNAGQLGNGAYVEGGSSLELTDASVVANTLNGLVVKDAGSTLTVRRTLVRNTRLDGGGKAGKGVVSGFDAVLVLEDSAVVDNFSANVSVISGGMATIRGTIMSRAAPDAVGLHGYGVEANAGTTVEIFDSDLGENLEWAVFILDGANFSLTDSVVRGPADPGDQIGGGVIVQNGATLTLTSVAVLNTATVGLRVHDPRSSAVLTGCLVSGTRKVVDATAGSGEGVIVAFGAALRLQDSTLRDNELVGLSIGGSEPGAVTDAAVIRTRIEDTRAGPTSEYGAGVQLTGGGLLQLVESVLARNRSAGLVVGEAGSHAIVRDTLVRDSDPDDDDSFGHGIVVADDGSAVIEHSWVRENRGIGLAFGRAAAIVDDVVVTGNGVGVHAQSGTTIREVTIAPQSVVAGEVSIVENTVFEDNTTRVGSGNIPLPVPERIGGL